jgi:hypothetical protein
MLSLSIGCRKEMTMSSGSAEKNEARITNREKRKK